MHNQHLLLQLAFVQKMQSVFLNDIGNERPEQFFREAIADAKQKNLPDVLQQAQAWLDFSIATRNFHSAINAVQQIEEA